MESAKFEKAIMLIDKLNSEDLNTDTVNGEPIPKELLYSQRMSQKLSEFKPTASEALQIAARAQHICRWKIPRNAYPMNKPGYLKWRGSLKKMHAEIAADLLKEAGYADDFIEKVTLLISKKQIKKHQESQILEDVICLVFLDYYYEDFAEKHSDEKVVDILKKTWRKMSDEGHTAALQLNFSEKGLSLIKKAIT